MPEKVILVLAAIINATAPAATGVAALVPEKTLV